MDTEDQGALGTAFLESVTKRFHDYKTLGDKTFQQLSDEQLHIQPNRESNSIAVIIQHMHGNMLSRWSQFLTEDGEKPWRDRDAEFEPQSLSRDVLMQRWNEGWMVMFDTLASLTEKDLLKTITIRSKQHNAIDAINRQLAHYSYHIGQIVYLGRWLQGAAWKSLSIPKGTSQSFNETMHTTYQKP